MSLLAATIADAQRPLPGRGGTLMLRRAALEEPEPEMVDAGDPAALTVYRFQKDGASAIAPVAPARGSETISRDGPSAGIKHASDVGDPGVGTSHVERRAVPFVEGRNESNVRESRFVSTETPEPDAWSPTIPPPQRAGSSPSQTASSVSLLSDVDSQSETSGQTDQRSGWRRVARSAPSESLDDPPAPSRGGRDPARKRPLTDAVASGRNGSVLAVAGAGERAPIGEAATDVPIVAEALVHSTDRTPRALRDQWGSDVASRPTGASRARPPLASDDGAPHVHIGRIDVTVLAETPAPAAGARGDDGDRHFLSRHYLRRP
jgi:hypothetical protein